MTPDAVYQLVLAMQSWLLHFLNWLAMFGRPAASI